jgi:ribosome-associated protein
MTGVTDKLTDTDRGILSGCRTILEDKKALDTVILDLAPVNPYFEYFIITTGGSMVHCRALAKDLQRYFAELGRKERSRADLDSPWIILDYDDIIVHVFTEETRAYYQLEKLWADAGRVPV